MGQSAHHYAYHGYLDESHATFRETLVVLGVTTMESQPGEGAFDNPSARQNGESFLIIRSQDRLQSATEMFSNPVHKRATIGAIHPDETQFLAASSHAAEQQFGAISILDRSGAAEE